MKNGFTLLEMSIIIIIIGTLAGGIFVGTNIMRLSEAKRIFHQVNQAITAINTYNTSYDGLPGDTNQSSKFWGTQCDPTPSNCDGNNDGNVTYGTTGTNNEALRLWQLLGLAKVIEGSYTGVGASGASGTNKAIAGQNILTTSINGVGLTIASDTSILWNNVAIIAKESPDGINSKAGISPDVGSIVDNKFDDGNPSDGRIRGLNGIGDSSVCTNGTLYNTAINGPQCRLFFYTEISTLQAGGSI